MQNRRELLQAFAAVAAVGCCGSAAHARPPAVRGCSLSAAAANDFSDRFELLPSCGVPLIDQVMPLEVQVLKQVFRVSPDFAFFNDGRAPNAFATPEQIIGSSPHGSVVFGIGLLRSELNRQWWGAAIAGICAHEWAHIGQQQSGLSGSVPRKELHADLLAGWYMGVKARAGTMVMIDGLGESLFSKGDFAFNNPDHHGTPQQRISAMATGYQMAARGVSDVAQAYALGRQALNL